MDTIRRKLILKLSLRQERKFRKKEEIVFTKLFKLSGTKLCRLKAQNGSNQSAREYAFNYNNVAVHRPTVAPGGQQIADWKVKQTDEIAWCS